MCVGMSTPPPHWGQEAPVCHPRATSDEAPHILLRVLSLAAVQPDWLASHSPLCSVSAAMSVSGDKTSFSALGGSSKEGRQELHMASLTTKQAS